MRSGPSWSPADVEDIAESLGGEIHLACARRPATGVVVVAAGFSAGVARNRAQKRAAALDVLHRVPEIGAPRAGGAEELRLADFMPDPPADGQPWVLGTGLLSRERYLLPGEVVWLRDHDRQVEPTTVGLVSDAPDGPAGGVVDLLAHDVVTRWWASPRSPLLRVSEHLPMLLPPGAATALSELGLWVSAFVVPGPDFRLAIVGVNGEGATIATAAARSVRAAVGEAFLSAMASRAQPWNTLPVADSLRRLTVWNREADYLAYLERSAVDADPVAIVETAIWDENPSWAEMAFRRFGHEPIVVRLGAENRAVKVVCPGAACYRPAAPGTSLPCPVP